jgi:ABC-type Fe3+ transport system substrate-binding protein
MAGGDLMGSNVEITLDGINLELGQDFFAEERLVLEQHADDLADMAFNKWTGWAYGKQYSPPRKYYGRKGTSQAGWRAIVTGAADGQLLEVLNRARDPRSGDMYAGFIHRVGKKGIPAWHEVLAGVLDSLPVLRERMAEAALEALANNGTRKTLRQNISSEAVFRQITD